MNASPENSTPWVVDTTADRFELDVVERSRITPVVVDFWAAWCQPCRTLKPLLEKLAAEMDGAFLLAKVDSDQHPEIARQFGVRGIPAVKAIVNGEVVNEFTGALPEAEVRRFIAGLLPSPAEPLRLAAREAAADGDAATARALLHDALAADPNHIEARFDLAELSLAGKDIDTARQLLDSLGEADDHPRLAALRARLTLAGAATDADLPALHECVKDNPADLAARLALAQALALAHDYRAAMEHLLDIVRRDRHWQEDAGRTNLLQLFTLLGADPAHDDLVREFRIALARTLN
jgi:putative thioredoxin